MSLLEKEVVTTEYCEKDGGEDLIVTHWTEFATSWMIQPDERWETKKYPKNTSLSGGVT